MHYGIVIGPASGSTFLRKNTFKLKLKTYKYITSFWLPHWFPYEGILQKYPFYQILDKKGYQNFPSPQSVEKFKERTGFSFDTKLTIEQNFRNFIKWDYNQKDALTHFNEIYFFKFFTANPGLYDYVLFVIRHPLYRYLSLVDKNRHYSYTVPYGGPDTPGAVQFFALDWNSLVEEALSHENHYILRYEYLNEDIKKIPKEARRVFDGWKPRLWRKNILSKGNYRLFYDSVKDNFYKIYNDWEIGSITKPD